MRQKSVKLFCIYSMTRLVQTSTNFKKKLIYIIMIIVMANILNIFYVPSTYKFIIHINIFYPENNFIL